MRSQLPNDPKNMLKTNPHGMFWGPIPFTAEFRLSNEYITGKRTSAEFGLSYLGKSPFVALLEQNTTNGAGEHPKYVIRGFRMQGFWRYYLGSQDLFRRKPILAPRGYYIGIHASFAEARGSNKSEYNWDHFIGARHKDLSFILGKNAFYSYRFGWEWFVGIGLKSNQLWEWEALTRTYTDLSSEVPFFYTSNLKLEFGVNLLFGYN